MHISFFVPLLSVAFVSLPFGGLLLSHSHNHTNIYTQQLGSLGFFLFNKFKQLISPVKINFLCVFVDFFSSSLVFCCLCTQISTFAINEISRSSLRLICVSLRFSCFDYTEHMDASCVFFFVLSALFYSVKSNIYIDFIKMAWFRDFISWVSCISIKNNYRFLSGAFPLRNSIWKFDLMEEKRTASMSSLFRTFLDCNIETFYLHSVSIKYGRRSQTIATEKKKWEQTLYCSADGSFNEYMINASDDIEIYLFWGPTTSNSFKNLFISRPPRRDTNLLRILYNLINILFRFQSFEYKANLKRNAKVWLIVRSSEIEYNISLLTYT